VRGKQRRRGQKEIVKSVKRISDNVNETCGTTEEMIVMMALDKHEKVEKGKGLKSEYAM
jgi:hypothetical protein